MKRFAVLLLVSTQIVFSVGGQPPVAEVAGIARRVPENFDISQSRGNEAETAVAISHSNRRFITSVSNIESNGLFHSWSTDGGHTWQHDVIATGSDSLTTACCDAQLASDDFGNIFLTYLSSNIAVKMAISIDGGATFQQLAFLTSLPSAAATLGMQFAGRAVPDLASIFWPTWSLLMLTDGHEHAPWSYLIIAASILGNAMVYVILFAFVWCIAWTVRASITSLRDGTTI